MKVAYYLLAAIFVTMATALTAGWSQAAEATGTCVHRAAPAGVAGKRVAVIVGNGGYSHGIPALRNPANDVEAVSKALGALGFEIFLATDTDSAGLQQCLDTAYAGLANADVAMFYYSGHGIQIKDANYLVATDAGTADLQHGFVPVQPIVDTLQKQAKATLVFLDACRNNPMAEGGQSGLSVSTGRGLSRVEGAAAAAGAPGAVQARGLMVAYATSPNAVAQDGTGDLSPFTGAFVKAVGTSGYSIQRIMSDVTKAVGEQTEWEQTPWMKSSLTDELKLGGGQTLAEAQSISDNHAARSQTLLSVDGNPEAAIVEALKGLPASPDEALLKKFPKAYLALYSAVQTRDVRLPVSQGFTQVAVSVLGRVAVYKMNADYSSGDFDLWSASDKKVIAKLPIEGRVSKFLFSPHGKLLATSVDNVTTVWNGLDGSKMFDIKGDGYLTSMEFSPDESRLLLSGIDSGALTVIDVATRKPMLVIKPGQLAPNLAKGKSASLVQANFGSDNTICFALELGDSVTGKRALGVYDIKEKRSTRLREAGNSVTVTTCDPAGKYMVRVFAVNADESGMEIWDLAHDTVNVVKAPIVNIMGLDPKGNYISVIAMANEAQGLYDLATGKRGHPDAIPDGYVSYGSTVRNASGGLVSLDVNPNAWRDWPDETLFGVALVEKAVAGLAPAQREEIARERITFAQVAANP